MTVHSHFTICMTIMEETSSSSSVSSTAAPALPRDEVKEVQHNSRHDTRRIRWWRMVVAGMIGTTAVAVTVGTYVFLDRQETENFENAVCCSDAVGKRRKRLLQKFPLSLINSARASNRQLWNNNVKFAKP